jgi:septum formation protein
MPQQTHGLVLASVSPRRREILSQLGLNFQVIPSAVEENRLAHEPPAAFALRMAVAKAEEVAGRIAPAAESTSVLGADTIVVVDDRVLGKPRDQADARSMLRRLSGRAHEVITAVALRRVGSDYQDHVVVSTTVWFSELTEATIHGYAASGEGLDKAGSYAIQGLGAGVVARIEGSYSNVVGLPATHTLVLLRRAGLLNQWP